LDVALHRTWSISGAPALESASEGKSVNTALAVDVGTRALGLPVTDDADGVGELLPSVFGPWAQPTTKIVMAAASTTIFSAFTSLSVLPSVVPLHQPIPAGCRCLAIRHEE
jgi:hypothetical protein